MIVIGDIHGCYETLMALLAQLPKDQEICSSGDLIDRGPYSCKVVELFIKNKYKCAMGNHEKMMLDATIYGNSLWYQNGGAITKSSYKGDFNKMKRHSNWMKRLPLFLEFPYLIKDGRELVVSHSSVQPVYDWNIKKIEDYHDSYEQCILWERPNIIEDIPGVFNIFGHTPSKGAIITDHYANIDSGCVYGNAQLKEQGYGILTALQFPEMIVYTQENIDAD